MSANAQGMIQRIIEESFMASEAMITVEVKKPGFFKKECVYLMGSVKNDHIKKKAEEIAMGHAGGMEVINQISVG